METKGSLKKFLQSRPNLEFFLGMKNPFYKKPLGKPAIEAQNGNQR